MARKAEDAADRAAPTTRYEPPAPVTDGAPTPHGEQRSSADVHTALLDGLTFHAKAVQYAAVDGLAIVEGDIVLGTVEEVEQMTEAQRREAMAAATGQATERSVAITGAQFRWPNATVPFEIDPALPNQQRVHDAIAHWQANTAIRLVPRASQADFVRFVPGGGCSSQVGRRGGRQDITLGPACTAGNCIHEIGHTIGLWHEQSREDRDHFVSIRFANITPGFEHNFDQHITDGDDIGGYDYGSVMHYPRDAFSRNGQDTIVPTTPGATIGQRTALSAGDLAAVRQLYPTPVTPVKKIRDDVLPKQVLDPHPPVAIKKLTDDQVVKPKQLLDPPVGFKKLRDDQVIAKKIRDTVVGPKVPVGPIGPGRLGIGRSFSPFILATPHHAPGMAGAEAGGAPTVGGGDAAYGYLAALGTAITSAGETAVELQALAERAAAEHQALHAEYESVVAQLQQAGLA